MAVTTYIASTTGTTTTALPAGTATGDIVVAFAYATSATIPTLPASWTNITSTGASPTATRIQYRVYDGVWAMPTFTGSVRTHALTIRGQDVASPIGVTSITNGNSTNPVFPAVTLVDADGSSQLIRGLNHTRADSVITAPANHTSRQAEGTQPSFMTCTKNSTADGASATVSISRGTTWTQCQVEIKCASFVTQAGTLAMSSASSFTATADLTPAVQGTLAMSSASTFTATAWRTPVQAGTLAMSSTSVLSLDAVSAAGGPATDPDTNAFFAASGLDSSYADPLDRLVLGLKAAGLWSKMTAIYPFIGGTAALHKWNLKDPRDADAAFRLTFLGGSTTTHSTALGYRANSQGTQIGSGSYADTHFMPSGNMDVNSTHLSFYSTQDVPSADRAEMGCYNWNGPTSRFHIIARYLGVDSFYYGMSEDGANHYVVPASSGLFVATRTSASAQRGYRNGVPGPADSFPPTNGLPNRSVFIGAINEFANRSDIPCGFASIGSGLDDADVTALWTVVETYQSDLGRATTVIGPVTQDATLAMSSASSLTFGGVRAPQGSLVMASSSSLALSAVREQPASTALTALSSLNFAGTREQQPTLAMSASSTLVAGAVAQRNAAMALSTTSSLTTGGLRTAQPTLAMTSTSTLVATATTTGVGQVSLGMSSASTLTLNAVRTPVLGGSLPMLASSSLSLAAVKTMPALLVMSSASSLSLSGVRAKQGTLAMASTSTLAFNVLVTRQAVLALATLSSLTLTAQRIAPGLTNVAGTGSLQALDQDGHWYAIRTT